MHSTAMTENETLVPTKIDWSSLSGVILDGGCELKDPLEVRDDAAKLRVRILGSGGRMGTAYFLAMEPKDANDQFDIWETLREVPHPNLTTPLVVGRRQVGGVDTIFAVMPDPDEKLAAVVPERPLEWEEAAEVLHSTEKGLAHLHAYGLMHGSVSPETVQAVGYTIQLDTESVRRLGTQPRIAWSKPKYLAPESRETNLTTASDVWCLGATLFEVLAQEPYGSEGAELEKGLPLGAVIARCLEKDPVARCTLKEAPAFAEARPVPAPAPPPKPEVKVAPPQPAAELPVEAKVEVKAEEKAATSSGPSGAFSESSSAPTPVTLPPPSHRPPDNTFPAATAARHSSASRLPHPLTPKPAPHQVTKEDMALVPVGKRHKKVQGKRAPVGARIRTLDGPSGDGSEETEALSGPAVAARMLGLGTKSNFVRGIVAGVSLAVLFVAAVWFIIIPKLQSPVEPAVSTESAQTASVEPTTAIPVPAGSQVTTSIPIPTDAAHLYPPEPVPSTAKSGADRHSAGSRAVTDSLTLAGSDAVRARQQQFRVVLSASDTQQDSLRRLAMLSQKYPELLLHIVSPRRGDPVARYLVVAGGLLTRSEADELRQRIAGKGLQAARVEQFR